MDYQIIIKEIRETLYLTQTEFAELLEVSFETVNRWENGKFKPSMKIKKKINELCKKYNIKLEEQKNEIYR